MKNTNKTTKSPAPAKETAKTVKKTVAAAAGKKAAVAVPKARAASAPSKATAAPKAGAVETKARTALPAPTVITAEIDVGFGNALYLRGEGAGLSWEKGVLMRCVGDNCWTTTLSATSSPVIFKFLLNDEVWCAGDDCVALPGSKVSWEPQF